MRNFALAILDVLLQLATFLLSPSSAPPSPPLVQIQVQVSSSNLSFLHSPMSSQPTSPPPSSASASQPCHLFQASACNATSTPTAAANSTELDLCIGLLSKIIHTILDRVDAKEIDCQTFASKVKIIEKLLSTIELALDCDQHLGFTQYERCPS